MRTFYIHTGADTDIRRHLSECPSIGTCTRFDATPHADQAGRAATHARVLEHVHRTVDHRDGAACARSHISIHM